MSTPPHMRRMVLNRDPKPLKGTTDLRRQGGRVGPAPPAYVPDEADDTDRLLDAMAATHAAEHRDRAGLDAALTTLFGPPKEPT